MTVGIYQIIFIVAALACSVRCKGYGPGIGDVSRNIGGVGGGAGGANIIGAPGGQTGPGMGSYTGVGQSAVGGVRGSAPSGGAGNYGAGAGSNIGGAGVSGRTGQRGAIGGAASYDMSPKPYNVGYQSIDEQGVVQYKEESGDGTGTVRGKYGYTDSQGLYRNVEYVADRNGFKANIRTNEPGVGKDSPADVQMIVQQAPAGIQERYTPARGATGTGPSGIVGRSASGGYQRAAGSPGTSSSGVSGYPSSGQLSGTGPLSGGSGLFAGIKKSSSSKSTY